LWRIEIANNKKGKGGLDMAKNDVYIYYSGATDVTGKKLQDSLDISGGAVTPKGAKKIVIGWGAKTKEAVKLGKATVLNHPDKIRDNRNKFKTLQALQNAKVNVAKFASADEIMNLLKNGKIKLPLVGRKNYHQGGKGFWTCLTKGHVTDAIEKGAQYFQEYIPIKDEFRLHIFGDKLVWGVKKVQRNNMAEAFKEQHAEKIKNSAVKGNKELDQDTLNYTLEKLAGRVQPDADMIVRSNMRGWKFSHITKIDKTLIEEAVKAVKAAGLDFGAVDCCIDEDGKPWVIEINTGPGLDGKPFDEYVKAFKERIDDILKPAKKSNKSKPKAETKDAVVDEMVVAGGAKGRLKAKADLLNEMITKADDKEAEILEGLFTKIMGS
jgi:glutathione synthase/RimK-type ligase-like ATP-grasp enzyme